MNAADGYSIQHMQQLAQQMARLEQIVTQRIQASGRDLWRDQETTQAAGDEPPAAAPAAQPQAPVQQPEVLPSVAELELMVSRLHRLEEHEELLRYAVSWTGLRSSLLLMEGTAHAYLLGFCDRQKWLLGKAAAGAGSQAGVVIHDGQVQRLYIHQAASGHGPVAPTNESERLNANLLEVCQDRSVDLGHLGPSCSPPSLQSPQHQPWRNLQHHVSLQQQTPSVQKCWRISSRAAGQGAHAG